MNRLRACSLPRWLALIAIVAQLLLPARHALAMASADAGLSRAFCGAASPQMRQRLVATAPPELLQALARAEAAEHASHATPAACDLCAAMAALQLPALPAASGVFALRRYTLEAPSTVSASPPLRVHARRAAARGPPLRNPD